MECVTPVISSWVALEVGRGSTWPLLLGTWTPCSSTPPDLQRFIFFSFVRLVLQVFLVFWLYSTPTDAGPVSSVKFHRNWVIVPWLVEFLFRTFYEETETSRFSERTTNFPHPAPCRPCAPPPPPLYHFCLDPSPTKAEGPRREQGVVLKAIVGSRHWWGLWPPI